MFKKKQEKKEVIYAADVITSYKDTYHRNNPWGYDRRISVDELLTKQELRITELEKINTLLLDHLKLYVVGKKTTEHPAHLASTEEEITVG